MFSCPGEQPTDGSDPAEGGAFPAARPVAAGHAGAAGGADEQENGQCRFFSLSHFLALSLTSLYVSEAATEGEEPGWGSGQRLKSEPGREKEEQTFLFPQASWIHLTRGGRGGEGGEGREGGEKGEGGGGSGGQLERAAASLDASQEIRARPTTSSGQFWTQTTSQESYQRPE